MRAVLFEAFEAPLHVQTVPDPTPEKHGVVLKVEATGLCRSDWHGWMGHDGDVQLPHVPGHELAGVVEELARHEKQLSGDWSREPDFNFDRGDSACA